MRAKKQSYWTAIYRCPACNSIFRRDTATKRTWVPSLCDSDEPRHCYRKGKPKKIMGEMP